MSFALSLSLPKVSQILIIILGIIVLGICGWAGSIRLLSSRVRGAPGSSLALRLVDSCSSLVTDVVVLCSMHHINGRQMLSSNWQFITGGELSKREREIHVQSVLMDHDNCLHITLRWHKQHSQQYIVYGFISDAINVTMVCQANKMWWFFGHTRLTYEIMT